MANKFFDKIIYSSCNEDSESERKALSLKHDDVVLCITGSGARALDLLVDEPLEIISVDFNITQNYLLALKIAAYQTLDYSEFAAFIGLEKSNTRLKLFSKVSPNLLNEVRDFWNQNKKLINQGILYCGVWESLLRLMAKTVIFRKKALSNLLNSATIEEQSAYWNQEWDNKYWRFFLRLICIRFLWAKIIKEPGARLIPKDFNIYGYLRKRFNHLGNTHLIRFNHFANLIFLGHCAKTCILPIHLQEANFDTIKRNVGKIKIVTNSIQDILIEKDIIDNVRAYSLSDFSSYADMLSYNEIWQKLSQNARDGSRFCERQFLIKRSPEELSDTIVRDPILEERLSREDSAFIYSFCVGTINNARQLK